MKYLILVPDGAADRPCSALGNRTPLEAANKPVLDRLSKTALIGTVSNVPEGMIPESSVANLSILSYDPLVYSTGRSPLEAVSMGLTMDEDQTAFRCNVVTLSEEEGIPYAQRTILDHSADEISTEEAAELIRSVQDALGDEEKQFYPGISYRHCLLWRNPPTWKESFCPPHDILGREIRAYLPEEPYRGLLEKSYGILQEHPINRARREKGLRPANSIWLWGPGTKPALPSFEEKWGVKGAVISAVDLIKGIGICAGMASVDVAGATGNIHTNFRGKAEAAIALLQQGMDLVYLHVEAPDECGHRAELANKVLSIERIDGQILSPVVSYLEQTGEPFRILILPDHPTPVALRTHTSEPVPFMIYCSDRQFDGADCFSEAAAEQKNNCYPRGYELMALLMEM